jgi:hypothetical protein
MNNFSKLPSIVSNTTRKFCPDQYFQVVRETFPGSFGNVSCIKNAFGTVYISKITYARFFDKLIV